MDALVSTISQLDATWLAGIHTFTNPVLDWAAWIISQITWLGACWFLLAAVLWFRGQRVVAVQMVLALVISALAGEALKHMFHRVRPEFVLPQYVHLPLPNFHDSRWSFPSGHAIMTAAATMAAVFGTHKRWAWWTAATTLLVGWARVYQGVHWPSDVIASFIIGIICAAASVAIVSFVVRKKESASASSRPHTILTRHS